MNVLEGLDGPEVFAEQPLTPVQQEVFDELLMGLSVGNVCVLQGGVDVGKTTILRKVQRHTGGAFVTVRQFMTLLAERQPTALEETFLELIDESLQNADVVLIDDLHLITSVVEAYEYPRAHLLNAVLTAVLGEIQWCRKSLLFAVSGEYVPEPVRQRAYLWEVDEFTLQDYETICRYYLGSAGELNYAKIFRFAPALNGYQLRNACAWVRRGKEWGTDEFIEYLSSRNMTSNVDLEEVEAVDWQDLKGADNLIAELEAKVALPFENDALAAELKLKPKRGVLLAGPPGTGKTTIGRALARRLKGKFFLIDGTVIAGSNDFYEKVERVFEDAKKNSPSVIFIDDADVIFEDAHKGFYRYLLTMLDGLESASAQRVCVMMTAMEVGSLPPALLRSGRIELWLETRLPDEESRAVILRDRLAELPRPLSETNVSSLAKASRGLTGADLKAVVEDAKLLFAHHQAAMQKEARPVEDYFLKAIATIRANRASYGRRKGAGWAGNSIGFKAEQD
ncbi:MAG: AAA family ATPase [Bryobacteraceae bacterium]